VLLEGAVGCLVDELVAPVEQINLGWTSLLTSVKDDACLRLILSQLTGCVLAR
jgi:hypothetical protein